MSLNPELNVTFGSSKFDRAFSLVNGNATTDALGFGYRNQLQCVVVPIPIYNEQNTRALTETNRQAGTNDYFSAGRLLPMLMAMLDGPCFGLKDSRDALLW